MKSVLISILPKWCELIASGKKTIDVRKTKPKISTPFKCYMYMTKDAKIHYYTDEYGDLQKELIPQRIIGEFVCDKVIEVDCDSVAPFEYQTQDYIEDKICFGRDELIKYAGFTRPFGWHISDLVIYEEPKELSEFTALKRAYGRSPAPGPRRCPRPPQSWCYVEELQ